MLESCGELWRRLFDCRLTVKANSIRGAPNNLKQKVGTFYILGAQRNILVIWIRAQSRYHCCTLGALGNSAHFKKLSGVDSGA